MNVVKEVVKLGDVFMSFLWGHKARGAVGQSHHLTGTCCNSTNHAVAHDLPKPFNVLLGVPRCEGAGERQHDDRAENSPEDDTAG